MARKTPSRLELRKQMEAAGTKKTATGEAGAKKKRVTKKKKATKRTKKDTQQRKRLIWGVFNAAMKEEARFPYHQRAEAEEKVKQLHSKNKKPYFIQPIKEVITDPVPGTEAQAEEAQPESEAKSAKKS